MKGRKEGGKEGGIQGEGGKKGGLPKAFSTHSFTQSFSLSQWRPALQTFADYQVSEILPSYLTFSLMNIILFLNNVSTFF